MTGVGRHNWRVANFVPVGTLLIARAEEYLAEAAGIFEILRLKSGRGNSRATFLVSP